MQPSWTFDPSPTVIGSLSPRSTLCHHTLAFWPSLTLPITRRSRRDPEAVVRRADAGLLEGVAHVGPPASDAGILMAAADLERMGHARPLRARARIARSLAIYGQPWRARAAPALRPVPRPGRSGVRRRRASAITPAASPAWARVIAIEPQPAFAAWLRRLFRARPEVTVLECALAATQAQSSSIRARARPPWRRSRGGGSRRCAPAPASTRSAGRAASGCPRPRSMR